ncbi:MAG: VOC family protein [Prosthecobacter sp.]|nr:VOC family protein [Prosthecobacter sp.]
MSKPMVQAYLNFNGRCEEAVEFYRTALGAQVDMMLRFQDAPKEGQCPPDEAGNITPNKIMHCSFRIGESTVMASDCRCEGKAGFEGFSLSLTVSTEAEADHYFAALSEGGKVEMPLGKTFFSPRFGVVSDRFGVSWMVVMMHAGQ